ncbi:hypothetical protein [Streptomyces sp. bgisy027]|uniref:hypothetical protein n=1 Tax=Streptomyces sp. bgisy027 TaxID=3413770 RepID=UPI003D749504
MPVEEQQSGASAAAQGEEVAEQDGAVAAADDREAAAVEDATDGVGRPEHSAVPWGLTTPVSASRAGSYGGGSTRPARTAGRPVSSPASSRAVGRSWTPDGRRPGTDGASMIASSSMSGPSRRLLPPPLSTPSVPHPQDRHPSWLRKAEPCPATVWPNPAPP